jgi:PadR family transcriptional regulator AphA
VSFRHAVLGLLADEPASGYDLKRRFERTMRHVWAATQSQVYTELGKLADDQLIEVSAEGARGRKVYAITQAGREELTRWIREPQHTPVHNVELLKTFMLAEVAPDDARVFLSRLIDEAQDRRAELRGLRDEVSWDASSSDLFGRVALEWGLRFVDFQIEWARWALLEGQLAAEEDGNQLP